MFNVILFGPPGSGKGTQSEKLIQRYGLKHLSTGDLLRSEIAAKTLLGISAKEYIDKGQLVPDAVVIDMIEVSMKENPGVTGFLFDGFPRTEAQAIALDALLQMNKTEIDIVLSLKVGEEELVRRLLNRGLTSSRSDDSNEAVIRARIAEYHAKTSVVAHYYQQFGKVSEINGEGSMEEIFRLLCQAIEKIKIL